VTTAIIVRTSQGVVGRCDARCHGAISPECDCICGGRLHGIGVDQAIEQNTRLWFGDELADELRTFAERNGIDAGDLTAELAPPSLLEVPG
jgi:hypothetical protein